MSDSPSTDLRARLLEGALVIVNTDGAAGLTVRAVAKAAGCSTMGVYTHFQGKSGLLDAVVEAGFDSLDATLQRAYSEASTRPQGIVESARAYHAWALAHPAQFQAMFVPGIPGYDPATATRDRMWDTYYAHRARVAAALDSSDADPAKWQEAAATLWAIIHGHVMVDLFREAYGAPEVATDVTVVVEGAVAQMATAVSH